jgi:CheY-like chemotaxis protein
MVSGERAHSLLENAARATDHGAGLTRQLLAFARRQNLQPEALDLNALVSSMQQLLSSTLGRGIEITAELAHGAWPALADATQLELVLLNLAINARDAMPNGGQLIIGTGNATRFSPGRPEEPPPGDYAMLSVRDTGCGMAPDVMARIFEPFFTTKDVGRGTGLGLPQVLGVVQQLGGGVAVVSAPGQGTTISVFLPRALSPPPVAVAPMPGIAPTAAPEPLEPPPLRGLTILRVDDDTEVRHVTRAILEDMGALVCEAASGAAALLLLGTVPDIDLALADYTMPEMTGLELANHIAVRWPDMPIVLMTGYSAATLEGGVAHISAVLQKPFRADKLIITLRQALARDVVA